MIINEQINLKIAIIVASVAILFNTLFINNLIDAKTSGINHTLRVEEIIQSNIQKGIISQSNSDYIEQSKEFINKLVLIKCSFNTALGVIIVIAGWQLHKNKSNT